MPFHIPNWLKIGLKGGHHFMSPLPAGAGNPYGDESINPSTGEKFPHIIEEAVDEVKKVEEDLTDHKEPEPVPSVSSPTPPPTPDA